MPKNREGRSPPGGGPLLVAAVVLAAAVLAAVHHSEVVAHRVGEPFGWWRARRGAGHLDRPGHPEPGAATFTTSTPGPTFSSAPLAFAGLASLAL
jgi:hypothetical protein